MPAKKILSKVEQLHIIVAALKDLEESLGSFEVIRFTDIIRGMSIELDILDQSESLGNICRKLNAGSSFCVNDFKAEPDVNNIIVRYV